MSDHNHAFDAVVFTERSLALCLGKSLSAEWFRHFEIPSDGSWGVLSAQCGSALFVVDEEAKLTSPLIVMRIPGEMLFPRVPINAKVTALQRVHRVALQSFEKNPSLPTPWGPYHVDNMQSFFAYPYSLGRERVIAALMAREPGQVSNVYICGFSSDPSETDLRTFKPDRSTYHHAVREYPTAISAVSHSFESVKRPALEGTIDLDAIGAGSVIQGLSYSSWLAKLSNEQRRFVEHPSVRSLKLRGPAGSGKTLALQLKALNLLYNPIDGKIPKVVFITHSWAVAEQVQDAIERLDERGLANTIDVVPLSTLAEESLPAKAPGYTVLGEDSHSGKLHQLEIISGVLESFHRSDWPLYRRVCSEQFVARVNSTPKSGQWDTLVWDLMLEFACVISANGILPGVTAHSRYLKLSRAAWMMPLANESDKQVVLLLYTQYVKTLEDQRRISIDQLISDYLNYLATFHWHALRKDRGYDFVIVDELHLFNEQERLVFHQLTRDPDNYPILFMALDPRQSPAETYAEFNIADTGAGESGRAARTYGSPESIDLTEVHRFTPEILRFLKHVDGHFPALALGSDWGVSIAKSTTTNASGAPPLLIQHADMTMESKRVLERANDESGNQRTVAVLCLDLTSFSRFVKSIEGPSGDRWRVIRSRDDVEQLRYSRRKIVLSMPEYVAGLQFDSVLICGLEARFARFGPHQGYELRRFVSALYLGASRASKVLEIHFCEAGGDMPLVIQSAVLKGAIKSQKA